MTLQERETLTRKLQGGQHLYVPICTATRLPFVVCDEETFNDQVHLFMETGTLAEFLEPYKEEKYEFTTTELAPQQRLRFLLNLYSIGVNAIVLHDGAEEPQEAELKEIVNMVDYSKMPESERPLINAELQLSAIYFLQELRRPVEKRDVEKLVELEEEMCVNLMRSSYLMPIDIIEEDTADGRKRVAGIRFPYLKNHNDQLIQPIFTDGAELQKFIKDPKIRIRKVSFAELDELATEESVGYTLNPFGVNLIFNKEQIKELIAKFQ